MTKNDISGLHPIHEWHQSYIRLTEDLPVLEVLKSTRGVFDEDVTLEMEQLGERIYAPEKWCVKDILQHLNDTERILSYRALRIARGDKTPLPGFDEKEFAQFATSFTRSINSLLAEFDLLRQTTITLYQNFDQQMLRRTGNCNGVPISVLALGYVIAGHPLHHLKVLQSRYFPMLDRKF